eukprot:2071453-Pyramimonas_sp.AAC.1
MMCTIAHPLGQTDDPVARLEPSGTYVEMNDNCMRAAPRRRTHHWPQKEASLCSPEHRGRRRVVVSVCGVTPRDCLGDKKVVEGTQHKEITCDLRFAPLYEAV